MSLVAAACSPHDSAPPEPPRRAVIIATAVGAAQLPPAKYAGTVRSEFESRLAFRLGGQITARLVGTGDAVAPGQVLMRLDPKDAQQSANAAVAQLRAAEVAANAQAKDMERSERLLKEGFISKSEYDRQRSSQAQSQAQLASARAQSETAAHQLAYTDLKAPRASLVSSLQAEAGDVVAAGQPVITVSDPTHLEVAISVPEDQVAALQHAEGFSVSLWANPGLVLKGRLHTLAGVADSVTRTYDARIRIEGDAAAVRLGQTAEVQVFQRSAADVVRVPLTALDERGGKTQVWLIDPTSRKIRRVEVRVSGVDRESALVASGLKAGDQVVGSGVQVLRQGETVQAAHLQASARP